MSENLFGLIKIYHYFLADFFREALIVDEIAGIVVGLHILGRWSLFLWRIQSIIMVDNGLHLLPAFILSLAPHIP